MFSDHLKNKEFTYVTVSGDDSASIVADVIEVNFSSALWRKYECHGWDTLRRKGVAIGLGRFRSDLKGKQQPGVPVTTARAKPQPTDGSFGNGYIELQDYGCIGKFKRFRIHSFFSTIRA